MDNFKEYLNKSSRDAYGIAFYKLAESDDRIVAVTADVPDSVRFSKFRESWPERFFNFGIAEQNMMGAAAGLAREGKIPYVSVYAIFATLRALEQVRTDIAYPSLPVRICTTHSGISLGQAGPSHHSIEDVAIMRSISNMTVVIPADGPATAMALNAIKDHPQPVYMRLSRAVEQTAYPSPGKYQIGKANILRKGSDISIMAYGASVGNALKAADILAAEEINAGVIDMAFIKPMDKNAVVRAAKDTKRILTVEEHNLNNALGSAVAEIIAESNLDVTFRRLALPDDYTLAGPYEDLQKHYCLDPKGIADKAKELF